MSDVDDLVTRLRAQLDDDEQVARAADSGRWLPEDKGITFEYTADDFHEGEAQARLVADTRANQEHIARHDPARVLAEVDAKRRILDRCAEVIGDRDLSGYDRSGSLADEPNALALFLAVETMRDLALPSADRPGYRDEWKP